MASKTLPQPQSDSIATSNEASAQGNRGEEFLELQIIEAVPQTPSEPAGSASAEATAASTTPARKKALEIDDQTSRLPFRRLMSA